MFEHFFFHEKPFQSSHSKFQYAVHFLLIFLCWFQTGWSQTRDREWPYNYLPQLIIFGVGVQPTGWQELQRMYPSLGIREGDRFIFTTTWLDALNASLGHSIEQDLEQLDVRTFRRTIVHSKATYSLALYLQKPDNPLNIDFGKKIALAPYGEAEKFYDRALIDIVDPVPWWRGRWHIQFGPGEQKIQYVHLKDPKTGKASLYPLAHHALEAYMQHYVTNFADERDAPDYRPKGSRLEELLQPKVQVPPMKREEEHIAGEPPGGTGGTGGPNVGDQFMETNGFYRDLGEPRVGGVYLNGVAKMMSNFGEITGATYDAKQQRVIIVGNTTVKLPPFPVADLAVAFQSVFTSNGGSPGVSIDPARDDPHGPIMDVRYLGGVENTHFGWVLFEADRVMKALSLGEDNLTHQPITSTTPDFFNMQQLSLSNLRRPDSDKLWNRFWLVPDNLVAFIDPATNTLCFKENGIRVRTETMKLENNKLVSAGDLKDPRAEYFANHLTVNYDAFAAQFPVFAELARLARATGIVRWLQESGAPVAHLVENFHVAQDYETPKTTPSHLVSLKWPEFRGDSVYISKLGIFGGVDFSQKPFWAKDDGSANRLGQQLVFAKSEPVLAKAPGGGLLDSLTINQLPHYALNLPIGPTSGSLTIPVADILTYENTDLAFPLIRYFNSYYNEATEFGFGWNLCLPALKSRNPELSGKVQMVWVEGREAEKIPAYEYWLTDDFSREGPRFLKPFIHPIERKIVYVWQKFDETTLLYPRSDGSALIHFPNGEEWEFNSHGQIIWMRNDNIRFTYNTAQNLEKLTMLHQGQDLQLNFVYDTNQHVKEIDANGKKLVSYFYNPAGNLQEVVNTAGHIRYEFDANKLVTQLIQDDKPVFLARFDDFGRWER